MWWHLLPLFIVLGIWNRWNSWFWNLCYSNCITCTWNWIGLLRSPCNCSIWIIIYLLVRGDASVILRLYASSDYRVCHTSSSSNKIDICCIYAISQHGWESICGTSRNRSYSATSWDIKTAFHVLEVALVVAMVGWMVCMTCCWYWWYGSISGMTILRCILDICRIMPFWWFYRLIVWNWLLSMRLFGWNQIRLRVDRRWGPWDTCACSHLVDQGISEIFQNSRFPGRSNFHIIVFLLLILL